MASSSHRANLLNSSYKHIGIVSVNGTLLGVETTLVVQMFGTPQVTAVAQTPTTPSSTAQKETTKPVALVGPGQEKVAISQPAALTEVETPPLQQLVKAVNPISSPKTIPLGFGFVLLGLFALDEVFMFRGGLTREELRRTGQNIAHMSILGLLMVLVWMTRTGGII